MQPPKLQPYRIKVRIMDKKVLEVFFLKVLSTLGGICKGTPALGNLLATTK